MYGHISGHNAGGKYNKEENRLMGCLVFFFLTPIWIAIIIGISSLSSLSTQPPPPYVQAVTEKKLAQAKKDYDDMEFLVRQSIRFHAYQTLTKAIGELTTSTQRLESISWEYDSKN